jgi:dimethylargininase
MTIAICREVSPALAQCELTHIERSPINVKQAQTQHAAYEATLKKLGLTVISLPAEPDLPD